MLIKNVGVELKRSRLNLITNISEIKIVLCKGIKKGGCSRTQQKDQEEKGVLAVQRLSSRVFIKSRGKIKANVLGANSSRFKCKRGWRRSKNSNCRRDQESWFDYKGFRRL
jgi:hypothetical protein